MQMFSFSSLFRGPKFELVASGCLNLQDVDDVVRTFDLKLVEPNGKLSYVK